MRTRNSLLMLVAVLVVGGSLQAAQIDGDRDLFPVRNWAVMIPPAAEAESHLQFKPVTNALNEASSFTAITPCRLVDTRGGASTFGGPNYISGETRTYPIPSGPCAGIPSNATAYSLNFTIVGFGASGGFVTAYPTGTARPGTSTVNMGPNGSYAVANAAIVPAGTSGSIDVFSSANTTMLIDINGYFGSPASVAFARVNAAGTLDPGTPSQNEIVVQANVQHDATATTTTTGPGVYCFGGLPFTPRTAMVTADAAQAIGTTNFIASVAVQRGANLGNCDAGHQQARVSMLAVNDTVAPTLTDHGFYIVFFK